MTQPGEQEVIIGAGVWVMTRVTNSLASSVIVKSAAKSVSKTFWKPKRLRAATIFPSAFVPILSPNSSPKAARTAGAVSAIMILPSLRALSNLSISLCSIKAPVGQTSVHWPHWMQGTSLKERFSLGPTKVLNPRFSKPRIPIPWISLQAAMQRPHKTHLEVSRTRPGARLSKVVGVFSPRYLSGSAPTRLETSSSSHFPFFRQVWHDKE